jgi:methylated-DNA-protein-cysteine methyltransferase-like protein
MMDPRSTYRLIYAVVARIPRGRVATYGQVARQAGMAGQARLVGYALNALSEGDAVPWHRVVNAKGFVSARSDGSGHEKLQRLILKREGVRFSRRGAICLSEFRWRPKPPRTVRSSVPQRSRSSIAADRRSPVMRVGE